MTAQEILEIAEKNLSIEDFAEGYYDPTEFGFGEVKTVDEDQSSIYYTVRHFIDHNVYIRTEGYYSSYNGTDWDFGHGKEVFPVSKTIVVYE